MRASTPSSTNRRSPRLCQHHAPSALQPPPAKRRKISRSSRAFCTSVERETPAADKNEEASVTTTTEKHEEASADITTEKPKQTEALANVKRAFPFMDLPAELRVHVYRMALFRDEPLLLHLPQKPTEESDDEVSQRARTRARFKSSDTPALSRPSYDINVALLRTSQLVYKEARQVLYGDNKFILNIESGTYTLSTLHQRNRSLIKSVALTIPSHHDILDCFADVVRLGLRYCWGLKRLTITLPSSFRGDDTTIAPGATNVYANAFHILRWLPKGCQIAIEGNVSDSIRKVVADEGRLLYVLDEKDYLKRQHQMPERH
ncbi:hypothetical protein B0J11DRAFT_176498 [Dendryphion nanum]|uniref:DUF7730 domain-containing protein n=1 Tax=Dendryphion nanum TaxID=256645 RepID=A0A9P9EG72_9PLEO|nr:hypothetical protein B0J11DRAFT_176498 [Dendryphion nanum]